MDKRVRERVTKELEKIGSIQKSDVKLLIKTYDDAPDVNKLIDKYYSSKADSFMATYRDEKRIRNCYAVKNPDNTTKYVDLSKPLLNDKRDIDAIKENFKGKNKANMLTIIKAELCSRVIAGQISLEEYKSELIKELSAI